jgi:hypothetical protein
VRKLLGAFEVMPVFIDFLNAFGTKPDATFGGCQHKLWFSAAEGGKSDLVPKPRMLSNFEVVYNFKSAVRRRGKPPHNWSIRQTVRSSMHATA